MIFRRTILDKIQRLDPDRDDHRILFLNTFYEFPWDGRKAMEFALFRTYAVPSIGALLDSTGEFRLRAQKRFDDTDILFAVLLENGYASEAGRAAIRRMNRIHGRFSITNADYLYVLSTFVFEPIRWMDRFGWRPFCEIERLAQMSFWRKVGQMMGIQGIPTSLETFDQFNRDYEHTHFRYTAASRRVADATLDLFLGWYLPKSLHRFGAPALHALMDPPLLASFGFPEPPAFLRKTVTGALRARGRLLAHFPERRQPKLESMRPRASYPNGYVIDKVGPAGVDS